MKEKNVKVVADVEEVENDIIVEDTVVATDEVQEEVSYRNLIKKLIAGGCTKLKPIRIKNVNATEKDNYTMVSLTLATPIKGFVSEDDGVTFKEGMTNIMFTSTYAIAGAMKEDEELGWMANALTENPQALNLILNGSTVEILQQYFVAGEPVVNPFSTKSVDDSPVYDHDVIVNHIIGITLGKIGQKMADRLADKLLGF